MRFTKIIILIFCLFFCANIFAQDSAKQNMASQSLFDSSNMNNTKIKAAAKDSFTMKPKFDPHKATIRSAIIPGWGQAYNHEYWKIPIVYAAIVIPAITYVYNNTWYHRLNYAFNVTINYDTANYKNIYPQLQPFFLANDANDLQNYRNEFLKNRDYSLFYFFIAWGLNVVDATVFAHLKLFDVSDDISLNVHPDYDPQTKAGNLGLVFSIKKPQHKIIDLSR